MPRVQRLATPAPHERVVVLAVVGLIWTPVRHDSQWKSIVFSGGSGIQMLMPSEW